MTFFQTSFIKALQSREIDVPEIIVTGKGSRNNFTWDDREEIEQYCAMELDLMVQLADTLRDELIEAGIPITNFHGPGAVASKVFQNHGIRKYMQPPELRHERTIRYGYFGGRFELFQAGHYDGDVYVYDINSAYPHAIRNLPNLNGARWEYTNVFIPGAIVIYRVRYDNDSNNNLPNPIPWRHKNCTTGFPDHTDTWVWHPEAQYATTIIEGWVCYPVDNQLPFGFVNSMYQTRREWKAQGRGAERALKLALNSLYGKMAQRVGGSRIGAGSSITSCYIMGNDSYETIEEIAYNYERGIPKLGIGDNCNLTNVIVDKDCSIGNNVNINGGAHLQDADHSLYTVKDGIVVIKKGAIIPDGFVIE